MGNYALILALAGVVGISILVSNTRKASQGAQIELSRHTYKSISREAAMTGLNMTVRRVVADRGSWFDSLALNPDAYSYKNVAYRHNTTFSTEVLSRYPKGLDSLATCFFDTVDVVSTAYAAPYSKTGASYESDRRTATHRVEATYVRTCAEAEGDTEWSRYPTVSDLRFDIDGEIRVFSADVTQNAGVHSNRRLFVTNPALVEGYGTQTMETGGGCSDPCDTIFIPNDDTNGDESNFIRGEPEVEIPFFDYTEWEPQATHRDGTVEINSNTTIDFTNYQGITGYGTEDNPAIWFIDGDLLVNADEFQIIGYVKIVVRQGVKINGSARFITGAPAGEFPPESTYDNPNKAAMREWIATHLPGGTEMGIYAAGCYENDCSSNPGIHIDGTSTTVGQLFANESIFINDDATAVGGIATRSWMRYNAKNVIWYVGGNSAILPNSTDGIAPDGVRLLAFVEF